MPAAGAVLKEHSSARAPSPRRRFRLLDAMILVAATAIGFAVLQLVNRATRSSPDELWEELISPAPFDDLMTYCGKIDTLAQLTMPLVASLTLALIPIHLLGTRPRFRQLSRQPGLMAACGSSVAIAFIGLPNMIGALAAGASWGYVSRLLVAPEQIGSVTTYGGLAVLVSWITLYVGARWRAERSWVDRFGRALGLYWIMAGFSWRAAEFVYDCYSSSCRSWSERSTPTFVSAIGQEAQHIATSVMPLLAVMTLALIPIGLVRSRRRSRRLARLPGLVALFASAAPMALIGLEVAFTVVAAAVFDDEGIDWQSIREWLLRDRDIVARVISCGGLAVMVSWMTLLIGRQWRAKRNWFDRLGRAVGFCWILAAFAMVIGHVVVATDDELYRRTHPEPKLSAEPKEG